MTSPQGQPPQTRTTRVLDPEQIAMQAGRQTPFLRLPTRASAFADRALYVAPAVAVDMNTNVSQPCVDFIPEVEWPTVRSLRTSLLAPLRTSPAAGEDSAATDYGADSE